MVSSRSSGSVVWFLGICQSVFQEHSAHIGNFDCYDGLRQFRGGVLIVYLDAHRATQLFGGQTYFARTITPVAWATFIVSWVGVGAYHCFERWMREHKARYLIAGLCVVVGIVFAVYVVLIGILSPSTDLGDRLATALGFAFLSPVLGFLVYIAPGTWRSNLGKHRVP